MKGNFEKVICGILFLLAGVVTLPIMIIIALVGLLVNFATNIQCVYLDRKKYNEKKS